MNGFLLASLALGLFVTGCVNDVELDEEDQNIDVGAVTRSIFDPTNPVDALQLIPAPTALAQTDPANATGQYGPVDLEATAPAPCEGLTSASCLPIASQGGWPTSLSPELFFSSPIVPESAANGIVLLEVQENGAPAPLEFTIQQTGVDAPAEACLTEAGLDPDSPAVQRYQSTQRVVVTPNAGLQENRTYFIFATRALQGEPREEGDEPRPVEPSGLFFLLVQNGDAPVTPNADGSFTISGALLAQVVGTVRAALGPDATEEQVAAGIQASARGLFGLQTFFRGLAAVAEQSGLDRQDLVFANTWSTGTNAPDLSALPKVVFAPDPTGANNQTPFPNLPLVTTATTGPDGQPDVQNRLPVPAGGGVAAQIVGGLNTLNGWGTTTPIALSTTAPIDPATAEGNVLLVPYDATTNQPIGPPAPVRVQGAPVVTGQDVNGRDIYALTVQPLQPLLPDTYYALGIISGPSGLLDDMARPLVIDDTFRPLTQTSSAAARLLVACGTFSRTGTFPSAAELDQTSQLIEQSLGRSRWQPAFEVFANLDPSVPRPALSVAVPYKTQSITATLDLVDNTLLPNVYPNLAPEVPAVEPLPLPTINPMNPMPTVYSGQEAQVFVCSQLCAQGLFQIPIGGSAPIAPNACTADLTALLMHGACQLNASDIDEVRLFRVRNYRLTAGSPYVAGTFTPETVQAPGVEQMLVWYIAGADPAPAEGRPAMMFQHGLGSQKETGLLIANTLAASGWSTFLMDLPFHGDRASDIVNNTTGAPCPEVNPADVQCTGSACQNGCDDTRDPSGTGFLGLNVFAVRDNFRQSAVDHLTLIDHIAEGRFDDFTAAPADPDAIGYIGQSLGGITGGVTAAFAENLQGAVLNAAGGSLTTILLNSVPQISGGLLQALADAGICTPVNPGNINEGCQSTPAFNQFILLAQTALDPGDPLANAVGVLADRLQSRPALGVDRVLQQVALPDPVVANVSSFLLGGAYGFVDLATQTPTSEQFQVYNFTAAPNPNCHGFLLSFGNPVTGFCGANINDAICNTYGAQLQAAAFIDSAGTVGPQQTANIGGIITCGE